MMDYYTKSHNLWSNKINMRAPTQATTPYEEIVTQSEVFLCFSLNSYKSNSKRTHEGIYAVLFF